jgi:hypothetical protein
MLTPGISATRGLQRPAATPLPVASSSLSRSPRRRRSLRPRNEPRPPSAFADDPASLLSSLIDGVLVSAVVGGILLSALPLYSETAGRAAKRRAGSRRALAVRGAEEAKALSSSSPPKNSSSSSSSFRTERELDEAEADLEEEAGLKWGLATVVACLPLVGFTAWAFCAVDEAAAAAASSSSSASSSPSSSRAPLYWAFAGIYALASLRHGLSLEAGAVAVALACAAHVQVERAASSSFALGKDEREESGEEEDFFELFGRKTPAQTAAERASKAAARAAGAAADSAAAVARAVRAGVSDDQDDEEFGGGGGGDRSRGGGDGRGALPADTRRRAPTKEDLSDRRYDTELLRSFDERLKEREAERREEEEGEWKRR